MKGTDKHLYTLFRNRTKQYVLYILNTDTYDLDLRTIHSVCVIMNRPSVSRLSNTYPNPNQNYKVSSFFYFLDTVFHTCYIICNFHFLLISTQTETSDVT